MPLPVATARRFRFLLLASGLVGTLSVAQPLPAAQSGATIEQWGFDPAADRSLAGLNAVASRLGPDSQQRFASAVAEVFVGAMQNPPTRRDPAVARQALKAAAVRAALVNEGFTAGMSGSDTAARCDSMAMLLDVLHDRPLAERAGVTRLLLSEGLQQVVSAAVAEPAR